MSRPQPLILLPPSEAKSDDGDGPPWAPGMMVDRRLDPHRKRVLRAAIAADATVCRAPTRPAMDRYAGVLYKELDWGSLPPAARRRGETQVRIASGLWGLVAPTDAIPTYKLKMSAAVGDLGRLAAWWKPRLTPLLAERTAGATVWDLLPIEHSAAMDWRSCVPSRRITVRFVDEQGRSITHWNKLLKGSLVRWLLTTQPTRAEDLGEFDHPLGYRFDPSSSRVDGSVVVGVLRQQP